MSTSRLRVAALYSHPTQYAAPLFRELAQRREIDLTVYFLSRQGLDVTFDPLFGQTFQWDIPLLDGYKHKFLPNSGILSTASGFFELSNASVIGELRSQQYDSLLVHGYEHCAKWLAFITAIGSNTRLILRGESNLNEPRGLGRRIVKQAILRNLFRSFHGIAYIGSWNRQYYESYGVDPARLHFAPYSVDNAFFADAAGSLGSRRPELRKALGIHDDAPVILSVAKLISKKQPELLLAAFAQIRKRHACHLVFVGDGELRPRIEAEVQASGIPDVHITGFVNQTRIPEMLACGDLFVLASRHEPWGLAVNEAMASGLPIIATDRVGCGLDLVQEGVNGYIVGHRDQNQLAARLEELVVDPQLRKAFGQRSRDRIAGWSVEKTADGIVSAMCACAGLEMAPASYAC